MKTAAIRLFHWVFIVTDRIRRMGGGKVMFSVCPHRGDGLPTPPTTKVPTPRLGQDGGIPRYLPPSQGTYPWPGQDRGGGTQRYLPPAKVPTPSPARSGPGGIPQGTYPPSPAKVPTFLPSQLR